jgi:poly(3-hydroxyalkanoate) depolymerase
MKAFVFRTVTIESQSIRTAVRPGSPRLTPLLVFNGIGASLDLVLPFVAALDPDQEVIAFDVPGVGGSPAPTLPYRFSGLAKTVAKMLDCLGYERVNVIGISWGGFLAQQFAHDFPKRCERLILAATSAGVLSVPPSPRVLRLMASPRRYTDAAYGAQIAPEIYGGSFRNNPNLGASHFKKMKSAGGRGYFLQMMAVYWWSSLPWLRNIRQSTLVLAGSDDPLIPLVNMRTLANRIPNSELHVIEDGHLFLITQAKVVAPIVTAFLSGPVHADEDQASTSSLDSEYERMSEAL